MADAVASRDRWIAARLEDDWPQESVMRVLALTPERWRAIRRGGAEVRADTARGGARVGRGPGRERPLRDSRDRWIAGVAAAHGRKVAARVTGLSLRQVYRLAEKGAQASRDGGRGEKQERGGPPSGAASPAGNADARGAPAAASAGARAHAAVTDPGSDAVGPSREDAPPPARGGGFRSRGMRDLGPERMRRFRRVEARFLEVASAAGYREIRTPTVEPLHLFTGAGALSPQLLDRVYSFLDWDGWSGERVVLRPDSTLPAVRWFGGQADAPDAGSGAAARLCYVQPVYRFSAGDEPRELWQCGVELFGLAAPGGTRSCWASRAGC